jgi:hypothetical protein
MSGIRNGVKIAPIHDWTSNTFIFPIAPAMTIGGYHDAKFGSDTFRARTSSARSALLNYYPVFTQMYDEPPHDPEYHSNQYYTQIEVVGGFIGTLRVGINPGEMADLLLGIFGLDIYKDDLYPYKMLYEKKASERKGKPFVPSLRD